MTQAPERTHRRFSPSQAERFLNCPGSANLLRRVPARPSSFYAQEGTDGHTVFDAALTNRIRDAQIAHREHSSLRDKDLDDGDNLFYFSVQMALDYVYSILDEYPDAVMYNEVYVDPPVDSAPGEAGGYCDVAIYVPSIRTLFIIDYKHGAGVAKDAEDNPQILQYGAGFMFQERPLVPPSTVDRVVLAIAQPRAFHNEGPIREHECTPYEVWEYLDELDAAIAVCEEPDAPLVPGEDQCRFCDAATVCPAREAQALQVVGANFKQIEHFTASALEAPQAMDLHRLGQIRYHASTLRKWLDAVDDRCQELARSGIAVPGAKLVEAQARRKYYGSDEAVAEKLAAMIGEKDAREAAEALEAWRKAYPVASKVWRSSVIPVTHAEKLVVEAYKRRVGRGRKKKAAEEAKQAFAFLTLKQSSDVPVLVNEDDPRPPINRAQRAFSGVPQNLLPPPKK